MSSSEVRPIREINSAMALPKRNFLFEPMGMIIAIGVIVVLWSLARGNPATLVLIAIAVLSLLGLKRPLWAIAALLVSQFTITSYRVVTPFVDISLRLVLIILATAVLAPLLVNKKADLGPNARALIVPMLLLVCISTVSNLVFSGFDYAFQYFRNMMAGLLFVIVVPAAVRDLKDLKTLCGVSLVVITASAVIGVMQHYQFLRMDEATLFPGFLTEAKDPRVPGIAETQLELAYVLCTALLSALGILLAKGAKSANRTVVLLSMAAMAAALYFTYTRSALLAVGFGLISLIPFIKTRISGAVILVTALIAVMVIETTGALGGLSMSGRSESSQEESSLSRPILWQAGVAVAMDNMLLGIGGNKFTTVAPQYAGAVDPDLLAWEKNEYWGYTTLGNEPVHNDFLYMWVSFGIMALLIFVWLHFVVLQNCLKSFWRSRRPFVKGLSVGLAGAFVAYSVNAFYHNLTATLPLLWMLGGFSLCVLKLASHELQSEVHVEAPRRD